MTGAVGVALALAVPYVWGARRAARTWPAIRTVSFLLGVATLAVAVGGPLDGAADRRLEPHMVQHLLLAAVAPALTALGAPVRLALAALPAGGRRAVASALHARVTRTLALPPVALALPIAATLGFHLTGLFAVALRVPAVHALEHAALFWTALLAWAVLLGVDPVPRRLSPLAGLIGLTALMVPMAAVGAVYLSTDAVLFAHYARTAGALGDQHRAGTVMWLGGVAVLAPAMVAVAWRALLAEERRQRRREAAGVVG